MSDTPVDGSQGRFMARPPMISQPFGQSSLGSGNTANDPGRVSAPGEAKVDPSTRGPVNEVRPGAPQDAPQAAKPQPAE
jgi:hypothetical protein